MAISDGMLPMMYLLDWYWRVADDAARVFSSRTRELVAVDDEEYLIWCANHEHAHEIASYSELRAFLLRAGAPADSDLVTTLQDLGGNEPQAMVEPQEPELDHA